jgi:hypothetical protein
VFFAFERVLCPPSSAYRSLYCELMCHLFTGFRLFIDVCVGFTWAFMYSSICVPPLRGLSFCIREHDTHSFIVLCTVHMFAQSCLHFCTFCLAPNLLVASFLLEHSCLCFHDFDLAPSLLEASFLLEHSCFCFCDFNLGPSLLEASLLLEHSCFRFRDFSLAPSLLEASFLLEHSCFCFRDFNLAPSLLEASFLECYFVEPVGFC